MNLIDLVKLSNEFRTKLIENDGEVDQEMEKSLAIVEDGLPVKVDSYRFIIQEMESESEKFKSRADEFYKVAKGYLSFVDKLKQNLKFACEAMDRTELLGNDFKWKLQKSKSTIEVMDESLVPAKYKTLVQTTKIEKEKILDDLQVGISVPGCRVHQNTHMRAYPLGRKEK